MNSPSKIEKKSTIKNEDDRISDTSSKKTNATSVNGFPTHTKSQSNSKFTNGNKEDKRNSGMLSTSTIENTKERGKSVSIPKRHGKSLDKGGNYKKVAFKKKFLDIVYVESYKKYNIDLSYGDPVNSSESTRCRCLIF